MVHFKITDRYCNMGQSKDFREDYDCNELNNTNDKHDERKREFVRLKLNRKRSEQVYGNGKNP